jgi:hypothetical protein
MQRGICWARLDFPSRAIEAFDTALEALPSAYCRDRGVALVGKVACLAASKEPVLAAGADMAETTALRASADAVLSGDDQVEEAVPGSHGAGVIALKDITPGLGPDEMARALYADGVRWLLLNGCAEMAGPFLEAHLVDQVVASVPIGQASRRPHPELPWPLLPPGFDITRITKSGGYVVTSSDHVRG